MQRQRMRSLKAIADLARAGIGRHGSSRSAVQFRVNHLADRPGAYREVLEAERDHQFIETLTSAANGAALIIETYVERDAVDVRPQLDGDPRAEVVKDEGNACKVFGGVAQPNPSFLFEGSTVLECLISIAPEVVHNGGLKRHHGVSVYRLMCEIAEVAAESAGSPILSLQAPALVPTSQKNEVSTAAHETWPQSSSLAVRFSIAIGDVAAQKRVDYLWRLESYCRQWGLGLWVSDIRPNHRAGNWFEILPHDRELAAQKSRAAVPSPDVDLIGVLPLTLVGPARVGSTLATLESFGARDPAILASSITVLDDLAFIHFQLGLTGEDQDRAGPVLPNSERPCPRPTPYLHDLGAVLAKYGVDMSTNDVPDVLAGYTPLHGPAIRIATTPLPCRPVWLSWEVGSAEGGLRDMILGLSEALDQLVESAIERGHISRDCVARRSKSCYPSIEYLISRDLGVGWVRAKGKLQVPDALLEALPLLENVRRPVHWADRGVAVATTLEESWLMQLRKNNVHPRELRVAWREWWLGR
jgi:hypothetical protein